MELKEEPNGWATRLQRLLHEARRCARDFRLVTGGPVSLRQRQRLAEPWRPSCNRPWTAMNGCLRSTRARTRPQPGPAHDAPADEDLGLFPNRGGGPSRRRMRSFIETDLKQGHSVLPLHLYLNSYIFYETEQCM